MTVNLAGFIGGYRDLQTVVVQPSLGGVGFQTINTSIDKIRISGIELEASVRPFRALSINGFYAYLHNDVKDYTLCLPIGQPGVHSRSSETGAQSPSPPVTTGRSAARPPIWAKFPALPLLFARTPWPSGGLPIDTTQMHALIVAAMPPAVQVFYGTVIDFGRPAVI